MKKKRNSLIGIEISGNTLRMAEISDKKGVVEVVATGSMPLPNGCIKDAAIVDIQLLTDSIKSIYQSGGFRSKEVVIGLDGVDVIFRTAQFMKVSEDKQRNMILLQAQEFLPVSVAEMELDYTITGEVADESGTKIDAFLVAARSSHIENVIEACTRAKLKIHDVTASLVMLAQSVKEKYAENNFALVKTDVDTVNILFIKDGKPSFARTIAVAAQTAETKPFWQDDVAREIRSSVMYYNTRNTAPFDTIILLQQEPDSKGLADVIEQGGQLKVHEEDLFAEPSAMKIPKNVQGCVSIALNKLGGE